MYESDAKDAKSLYVTCLDEDPKKNDLIGDCVINLAKVLEQGEHDGISTRDILNHSHVALCHGWMFRKCTTRWCEY